MDKLVEKKAIITGGTSGIGRAAALLFAGAVAAVVIADVDDQRGEAVVKKNTCWRRRRNLRAL